VTNSNVSAKTLFTPISNEVISTIWTNIFIALLFLVGGVAYIAVGLKSPVWRKVYLPTGVGMVLMAVYPVSSILGGDFYYNVAIWISLVGFITMAIGLLMEINKSRIRK
jgi:hypothetical protein